MVYLFLGQDSLSKDTQLKRIKEQFLEKSLEQFNLDILYAKELTLKGLQEKLLCLPVQSAKRIVVVKDAQDLEESAKEFIVQYAKKPYKEILLILDISQQGKRDGFINRILKFVKVFRFRERVPVDTFTLSREIELKRADYALRVLNQLLREGERPERILGGLRYVWERNLMSSLERKNRLKLLLNCDSDIKRGRLKSSFALEKLVISLCGLGKPLR